jgi:hypothetical protein
MVLSRFALFSLPLLLTAPITFAQSDPADSAPATAASPSQACSEKPREDALVSLCAPPYSEAQVEIAAPAEQAQIPLTLPAGTPFRIAVEKRTRIGHPGDTVEGKIVETVYAFDQPVIPAGSTVSGRIKEVAPVPKLRRTLAYVNGNFSPFHQYQLSFDTITFPNGSKLPIQTTVSQGSAEVVRLVSNPEREKQKGLASREIDKAKTEAKGRMQEAKQQARDAWEQLTRPGKLHRLKEFLLAQLPYRRQYLEPGRRFVADLDTPLGFGTATCSGGQLALLGSEPAPDSTLKARLVAEVSSATATRGTPVIAMLSEPLYSPTHQLILPANSRLVGEVVKARPARKLHRNGELRVIFERIETSEEGMQALAQIQAQVDEQASSQAMIGNLEGVEVDRNAHMKLDEEGGAHTTDSRKRYLSSGLSVLLAAAASHTEVEHGETEVAGPGVRTAAGGSGVRITGALFSLVAKSMPVSLALGAYGASSSIYFNFLSRGHDVVLPKDTPLEIGFGPPHDAASASGHTKSP